MKSLPRPYLLVAMLFVCAFAAAGTLPGSANSANTTNSATHQLIVFSPTSLRQPANAADCKAHVYGNPYFDHVRYGCDHATANYIFLIWDYPGCPPAKPSCIVDGFHVFRTDAGRQDNGIHNDGTVVQIYYTGGRACWVVTEVRGNSESPDSNQFCIYPVPVKMQQIPH